MGALPFDVTDTELGAVQLVAAIEENNECTYPVFYMTWGRQNGDDLNCPDFPFMCTYDGMQLGLRNKDLVVLGELMKAGADLSLPRHASYELSFVQLAAASLAADEAEAAGWRAQVHDPVPDDGALWSLVCERPDVVLTPDFVRAADDFFQSLADRFAGGYDGWEAAVEPAVGGPA